MGIVGTITELEGTWLAVEARVNGEPALEVVGQKLSFTGNRFQIRKNGELLYGGCVDLDTSEEISTIEFDQNETDSLFGTRLGIYRWNGDALEICDNAPDMAAHRPNDFSQRNDQGRVWVRFARQH